MKNLNFFEAVAEARKGHIIKNEKTVLEWDNIAKELIYQGYGGVFTPQITEFFLEQKWEVREVPHDILWAAAQMEEGRKVRCSSWPIRSHYLRKDKYSGVIVTPSDEQAQFSTCNLAAKDWVLAD